MRIASEALATAVAQSRVAFDCHLRVRALGSSQAAHSWAVPAAVLSSDDGSGSGSRLECTAPEMAEVAAHLVRQPDAKATAELSLQARGAASQLPLGKLSIRLAPRVASDADPGMVAVGLAADRL